LRYNILTVVSFVHHPLELFAPSLGLLEPHLQAPNLLLGILQGSVELLLTVAKVYEIT
jgi:hypothetical protein